MVANGWHCCPLAGLCCTEHWVRCAGKRGLDIVRVYLFFSFKVGDNVFSCALIHQFCRSYDDPNPDNRMWIIEPDIDKDKYWVMSVVHVDSIVHAAHLLPVFRGDVAIPREINFSSTLNAFAAFYINKYIDYHVFELIF